MKIYVSLFFFTCFSFIFSTAQHNSPNLISSTADGLYMVKTGDLNGDGFLDVISASFNINKIAWYQNIENTGVFSEEKVISTQITQANSIEVADMDNDGDLDVLSSSRFTPGASIIWHENDGAGNFINNIKVTANHEAKDAELVTVYDLNNDGLLDVLVAANDEIVWFENLGNKDFSGEKTISNQADGAESVIAADFDNDGDLDVVSGSSDFFEGDKIALYKNNGAGIFSDEVIISNSPSSSHWSCVADFNEDGFIDILTSDQDKFTLHYNDQSGNFSSSIIIANDDAEKLQSVVAVDIDNDNDLDIVGAYLSSNIGWFENLGNGNFSEYIKISSAVKNNRNVHAADIDGDNDIDILSGSYNDNTVVWFENPAITTYEVSIKNVTCYGGIDGEIIINMKTGVAPFSFNWSNGDIGANLIDAAADIYTLTIASGNNQMIIDTFEIESPLAIEIAIDSIIAIEQTPGSINVTIQNGVMPYIYNWYDENNLITSNEEDLITSIPGLYFLEVIDLNGCVEYTDSLEVTMVSTNTIELNASNMIKIYPNPSSSFIEIYYPEAVFEKLSIVNLDGKIVKSINMKNPLIDISDLVTGVYVVQLYTTDDRIFTQKIVKQ